MPKPIITHDTSQYDEPRENASDAIIDHRAQDPLAPARGIVIATILSLIIIGLCAGAAIVWIQVAEARTGDIRPVTAPASLLRARANCPIHKPLACRAALVRAYESIAWQKQDRLSLAREMVGNVTAWSCIHGGEGSWTDTQDPYWGGLQMDRTFMLTYGADMIRRHHGALANAWTPREQIIVAQRAYAQGRGYAPWPATSHACGLR